MEPLENVTTQYYNVITTSLVASSTKVSLVAIEGIDVQRKLRRWRTIARKRELGLRCRRRRRRSRIRDLNRMLGYFVQSHFII
jgi:hypothetical protein